MNKDVALEFAAKWGALIAYVGIGLVGKFGLDIVNNRKLTGWYVFGTGCLGYFVGFLLWQWCKSNPEYNPGIIIPAGTLVSRDITLFLTMVDWQSVLKIVTGKSTKNNNQ